MISRLLPRLSISGLKLSTPKLLCKGVSFGISNRESPEQVSYYESRLEAVPKKYPHFTPTISIHDFHSKYECLLLGQNTHSTVTQVDGDKAGKEKIVGRVSSIRKHGKTTFIDVRE